MPVADGASNGSRDVLPSHFGRQEDPQQPVPVGQRSLGLAFVQVTERPVSRMQVEPGLDQGAGEVERVRRRGALAEGLIPTLKEPVHDLRHAYLGALEDKPAFETS